MKLSPEHRQLIRLLAEAAIEQFLEEEHHLLQTQEKPMETGERPHASHPDH